MRRRKFLAGTMLGAFAAPAIIHRVFRDGCWVQHDDNLWTLDMRPPSPFAASSISYNDTYSANSLKLDNSQFARPLPTSTNGWSKIRLSCGIGLAGTRYSSANAEMAVGFCHNADNLYFDATCDNFIGFVADTFTGQPGFMYSLVTSIVKKVGNTKTVGNTNVNGAFEYDLVENQPSGTKALYYKNLIVEIQRGDPNYTGALFHPTSSGGFGNASVSDILSTITQSTPSGGYYYWDTGYTLAFTEAGGLNLNYINIGWQKNNDEQMYLNCIAVARMA
jgi:hypothetical protein